MPDDAELGKHAFHILLALSGGDLHGSGIVRVVLEQSDGALRLWPATLYGTLEQLAAEGLIRELEGDERPEGKSERRRYYRVTSSGRAALAAEAGRLASLAELALGRVSGNAGEVP